MPAAKEGVMKYETVLPEDFTGVFHFTNWSEEDFTGKWNSVDYVFPALTTSPMIMPFSPLEIQNIRKKFAKDLAEREYFKSKSYESLRKIEGKDGERTITFSQARTYSMNELSPFIQKALAPLPISKAVASANKVRDTETELHRDEKGKLSTAAVKDEDDLNSIKTK